MFLECDSLEISQAAFVFVAAGAKFRNQSLNGRDEFSWRLVGELGIGRIGGG